MDEPVHISRADYVPIQKGAEIDPEMRPYKHQFEWYQDYYENIGAELARKNVIKKDLKQLRKQKQQLN